jgi:hypothetical protein
VHYCAEQFTNDTDVPNMIMKSLKRMMAGEYSRELSTKVFDGAKKLATLVFKQGGGNPLRSFDSTIVASSGFCSAENPPPRRVLCDLPSGFPVTPAIPVVVQLSWSPRADALH